MIPTGSRPELFLRCRQVSGASREHPAPTRPMWSCWLIAAGEQLLPVLAAHAVAFPVQIERVGWEHADRTLNVAGSVP